MSKTNIAYIQNPLYLYLYTFPNKIMQKQRKSLNSSKKEYKDVEVRAALARA